MTSQIGYLKLLITRSILFGPLDFEIKRVACINVKYKTKPLNLNVWKNEVKFYLQAEKMKPIKNNTYEKFTEAWDKW